MVSPGKFVDTVVLQQLEAALRGRMVEGLVASQALDLSGRMVFVVG